MPIFGGSKRPKLDGLTKDEEKRRDALNPEVLRRAGEKGVAGQAPAAAALLREKTEAEPSEYALAAAPGLADDEHAPLRAGDRGVRRGRASATTTRCAATTAPAHAYFEAAEAKLDHGDGHDRRRGAGRA